MVPLLQEGTVNRTGLGHDPDHLPERGISNGFRPEEWRTDVVGAAHHEAILSRFRGSRLVFTPRLLNFQ